MRPHPLPAPPILDPFALLGRDANGEGVGSRPHAGLRRPSVRSSRPRLDPDVRRPNRKTLKGCATSRLFGASLCSQAAETEEAHGGADKPVVQRRLWEMTQLGEPQSAAGDSCLVPGDYWCQFFFVEKELAPITLYTRKGKYGSEEAPGERSPGATRPGTRPSTSPSGRVPARRESHDRPPRNRCGSRASRRCAAWRGFAARTRR